MRRLAALAWIAGIAWSQSALAAEPGGCDGFKWPVARERALLLAPDHTPLGAGSEITLPAAQAIRLTLLPAAEAKLPMPPERAPKDGTFAGFVSVPAPPAGTLIVSMSSSAWIDVVQDGHFLKPASFSGATGCDGLRKTMKFSLRPHPATIQISGVRDPFISIALSAPAE